MAPSGDLFTHAAQSTTFLSAPRVNTFLKNKSCVPSTQFFHKQLICSSDATVHFHFSIRG